MRSVGEFASIGQKNSIWRLLLGIVLIPIIWIFIAFLVFLLFELLFETASSKPGYLSTRAGTLALLLSFAGVWAAVWFVSRFIHKQTLSSFFADNNKQQQVRMGAILFAAVSLLTLPALLLVWGSEIRASSATWQSWFVLAVPIILLTVVQATAEELLFRGYLLQKLSLVSQSWIVWALIPSVLFGLIHLEEGLGGHDQVLRMVAASLTGLFLCVLVWRTGSLWCAIAYHVLINVSAFLFLGIGDMLVGIPLWVFDVSATRGLLYFDIVLSILLIAFTLSPKGDFLGRRERQN